MKTFITSDLHFGHTNIMKFCPQTRGHYADVDVMREDMIRIWNSNVGPEDLTYILGDVAFLPAVDAAKIMNRLNGRKILIEGNHDRKLLKDPAFRRCFDEVHKYLWINYDGTQVVMFHYPILEWDQMHRGAVHFHGHLHGSPTGMNKYRIRDVGCDATGQVVWLMEDAIKDALKGEIKSHHG
jgi:calcineurin-like phosphoesterase family protein